MKKRSIISFVFALALAIPFIALAQSTGVANTTYIDGWVAKLMDWLSKAITFVMILMTLWFLWGIFKYVSEKDATKLPERRKMMLNGLIGLFVAVSVWGIIGIAGNVFGTKNSQTPDLVCPPGMEQSFGQCRQRMY